MPLQRSASWITSSLNYPRCKTSFVKFFTIKVNTPSPFDTSRTSRVRLIPGGMFVAWQCFSAARHTGTLRPNSSPRMKFAARSTLPLILLPSQTFLCESKDSWHTTALSFLTSSLRSWPLLLNWSASGRSSLVKRRRPGNLRRVAPSHPTAALVTGWITISKKNVLPNAGSRRKCRLISAGLLSRTQWHWRSATTTTTRSFGCVRCGSSTTPMRRPVRV